MDICFPKSKFPDQPDPGVVKLVETLSENIAYISGVSTTGNKSKDDLQKKEFWELCHSAIGTKNYTYLKAILLFFVQQLKDLSLTCYHKPNRATKLMKFMNQAMVFFHLQFQDMKESIGPFDHSSYYSTMTDLVALYLDMELHASRRRKEHLEKISGRLTSFIIIILDNSQEHILDALLKSRFSKSFYEICNSVLKKFLNSCISDSIDVNMYIRYILVYKLWKKIMKNIDEKRQVTKIAVDKLCWPPKLQRSAHVFGSVLPKIPKCKKDPTLFFIQAKFKIKTAYEAFMKSNHNYVEMEKENTILLEAVNNYVKVKKKNDQQFSKIHKICNGKPTLKSNYKKKLKKSKCTRKQKKKSLRNKNLQVTSKSDVPDHITVKDVWSSSIDETKLSEEFSLKNSINGKKGKSTLTVLLLSDPPKRDVTSNMEFDFIQTDLKLNPVKENNSDESQPKQMGVLARRDSMANERNLVGWKESDDLQSICAGIVSVTDSLYVGPNGIQMEASKEPHINTCTSDSIQLLGYIDNSESDYQFNKPKQVQGEESFEPQKTNVDIAVMRDLLCSKCNEVQKDESDKPQNIHVAEWAKSVYNEPIMQQEGNDEHQSMEMGIVKKCYSDPSELNHSLQLNVLESKESFNLNLSDPSENDQFDHKTANEYSSVDSSDFKMIIPKKENILDIDWIKETNCETKFIPNLVPFLSPCGTEDINSNCDVKQEVFDPDNVTVKQEIEDDIEMDVDPENQMAFNGKLVSPAVDSNDNYVSEACANQNLSQKSPFQLTGISDSLITKSQEQLDTRTNVDVSVTPIESLKYDFVSLDNIERTESVDNFKNSSLNQFSNDTIDDCEQIISNISKNPEGDDSVTSEIKQTEEHCQTISGAQKSLIVGKSIDIDKNNPKNAESFSDSKMVGNQNYTEDYLDKVIESNGENSDKAESEYGKEGAHLESSDNIICINNEPSDENTTIIIIQGGIYSDINQGFPSDTHFVTIGEYGIVEDPVESECDKIVGNDVMCSENINLHSNDDKCSNVEIDRQNEENACGLDTNVSNLKSKCQIERITMKDDPIQGKLTSSQVKIENESCTALEIPEALILETCGIGETVSTELTGNSINTITFIGSPTSIKMIIPGPITTQNINTCNSESIQLLGSVDNMENEYQYFENDQEREHTSQLSESQILSLKEFLIIKEKDLGGNVNELSNSENYIIEDKELSNGDTAVNSNSVEFTDCEVENSNCPDISITVSDSYSNVPSEVNDSETIHSSCKTEDSNKYSTELVINCDITSVSSNVFEPSNSSEKLEDIRNQKSKHELSYVAKLPSGCSTELENINLSNKQLLKSDVVEHPITNMPEVNISSDSLKDYKNSKSSFESDFGHVASNKIKENRLSRNKDAVVTKNQIIEASNNESCIENNNDTISVPDLSYSPDSSSAQDQNLTENGHSNMNVLNKKTSNFEQMECSNQKVSQQKQSTPLRRIISETEVGICSKETLLNRKSIADLSKSDLHHENEQQAVAVKEHSKIQDTALTTLNSSKSQVDSSCGSILVSDEVGLTQTSCYSADNSNHSVNNKFECVSPDVGNVIVNKKTSNIEYLVNCSNEKVLVADEINLLDKGSSEMENSKYRPRVANPSNKDLLKPAPSVFRNIERLIDKSSSERENSKNRAEDSNPSGKCHLEQGSSGMGDVIEKYGCSKKSTNEYNIMRNEMKLTQKSGPITEKSRYSAQDANQSTKHILEEISPEASGSLANWINKRFQHFSQKTTAVTKKSKSVALDCETKQLPGQLNIPQTEAANCSVPKISCVQVDNGSCVNNIQTVDKDISRKCNKRKESEEINSSSNTVQPVNFYVTPIMNGFSYSVGNDRKYTPMLQPPQAPEALTANIQLICKCSSCYAYYLKQSENSQTQDSAKHPFIPDRNYIYIDGELVQNEVLTVMKKFEWFLMHVMNDRKEPEDLEYKYKQDSESPNLPIKKRLTLAHMTSSKQDNKIVEEECFPSYSKKRMMSIAELEVTQNQSNFRPAAFEHYDAHLNPNRPVDDQHAMSKNLHLQSRFTNYNSAMVFNNSPYEYMSVDTVQQYFPHSDQQHTLQCSVDPEVVNSIDGRSSDKQRRYSLDRALEDVNKSITYSKALHAKSAKNYELRYKYNNIFQER